MDKSDVSRPGRSCRASQYPPVLRPGKAAPLPALTCYATASTVTVRQRTVVTLNVTIMNLTYFYYVCKPSLLVLHCLTVTTDALLSL